MLKKIILNPGLIELDKFEKKIIIGGVDDPCSSRSNFSQVCHDIGYALSYGTGIVVNGFLQVGSAASSSNASTLNSGTYYGR